MSKYIELFPEIVRMSMPDSGREGVAMALHWLDEHPDQVPGRTITRSEYRDTLNGAVKVSGYGDDWERGFNTGLIVSGMKVVPDPEPSNAELIQKAVDEWEESGDRCSLADWLDARGVKAGGDDE